jgi:Amiloride-sensitive sodium channel
MFCTSMPTYGFNENDTCNECLDTFRKIRIPPEDMFVECKFQNHLINCTTAFREIVLGFDVCYTFNGLEYLRIDDKVEPQIWNVDDGYKPTAPFDTYPRRALATGKEFGFSILLRINRRDFDFSCTSESGFWVKCSKHQISLNNRHFLLQLEFGLPGEIPQFRTNFFSTVLGDSMNFVLKPKILTTSNELRSYALAARKCIFSDEVPLRLFKQYTQSHCKLSCGFHWILEKCGCFPILLIKSEFF